MVNEYISPDEWIKFPPDFDKPRLKEYEDNNDLLEGRHFKVFNKADPRDYNRPEIAIMADAGRGGRDDCDIYVMTNYCKMASLLFANILFGTPPTFRVKNEKAQERLDLIVRNNMLDVTNHEQEIMASALGDAVYRVRWGKMNDWTTEGAIIESEPGAVYYPILEPGNIKGCKGVALAFDFKYKGQKYLYKETHKAGEIRYELWEMDGDSLKGAVPLDTVPGYAHLSSLPSEYPESYRFEDNSVVYRTDYPGLFVEHVRNWTKPDRFFGISDYSPDIVANQMAINEMQTGILRVCLKHMDPKLIMPSGTLQYDQESGKWYIQKEDLEVIELPEGVGKTLPRYVTWDAQLGAAKTNIDTCFEAIMMSFGISPSLFSWSNTGQADSAEALKLRLTQTLWVVGQKRMYFDAALKNVLYAAMYLDGKYGPVSYEPEEISITWADPLPTDTKHLAETLAIMQQNKLISQDTAVAQVQEIEGDALEQEIKRIKHDNRASAMIELSQLVSAGAINPEELLRIYRGEDIDTVLTNAKAPELNTEDM